MRCGASHALGRCSRKQNVFLERLLLYSFGSSALTIDKFMTKPPEYLLHDEIVDPVRLGEFGKNAFKIRCDLTRPLPLSLFVEAVRQAPVAISITDKKADILYINKEFTNITGYSANDIIGKNESTLSARATPREVYRFLWQTISHKEVWRGQLINRHKNGQRYLADLTIAPMLDASGAISHYIGMHRDVTQAHQSEQVVSNQKKLIESVINASPVAMVVLDSDHKIILDNQKYKMLISELGHKEPALYFIDALQQEMGDLRESKQGFHQREIRMDGPGRQPVRWFSCSGNWFDEEDTAAESYFSKQTQSYLLLSFNDISQQRRRQEKAHLQALHAMLAEEERIRDIREALLEAGRRLRRPLGQIRAAVERAAAGGGPNPDLPDILQQMCGIGEAALDALQQSVPEIPETAVLPVNLNQLLHEVMLLHSGKFLANGIVIDWLPTPVLPSIQGAENKLRMVFKQLFDNAVAAMNRAGSVERSIHVATWVADDRVYVRIADTGPGVPAHERGKLFEPLSAGGFRAGAGLAAVREIVGQHQGTVAVDSDGAKGCRFTLGFPCGKVKK